MIKNFNATWQLLNLDLLQLGHEQLIEVLTDFAMLLLKWFGFCFAILVIYWLFWPYEPIRVDTINVWPTTVKQGEEVHFQFVGEKFMPFPVDALIEVTNGSSIEIMTYKSNQPKGTNFKIRSFIMPFTVKPENVRIRWTGVYHVNPIRNIVFTKTSDFIKVLPDLTQGEQGKRGIQGRPGKNFWGK